MAIPAFQDLMLPLLKFASDGQEHTPRETVEALAEEFSLSEADRQEMLPSGRQATYDNRVAWAKAHMKMAGLLGSPKRGVFRITERGKEVVNQSPPRIDIKFLKQFPEYIQSRTKKKETDNLSDELEEKTGRTPEESMEAAHRRIKNDLENEIVQTIKSCSPRFFEQLVVELIVKMGYGGSRQDAGRAVGKSADGGIDGIIKEDKLGLDNVYIQAKRWENSVSRPEIQKFAGALQGHRARKGIFITTSSFTNGAREYVSGIDSKIVLIDGDDLAELMIDFDVGVSTVVSYNVKKIDMDYFTEE
ncbi:MAG: restriction endonuclease [Thermoleophilia bacterium]